MKDIENVSIGQLDIQRYLDATIDGNESCRQWVRFGGSYTVPQCVL